MTPLLAVCTVLLPISVGCCFLFARLMRRRSIGQLVREVGPRSHASKAGTPTMGGSVVLALWALAVLGLMWRTSIDVRAIGFVLAAGVLFGGIGLLDDALSIRRRHSTGLNVVQKLALSFFAAVALFFLFRDAVSGPLVVPFTPLTIALPPVATFFLTWVVLVGTTNSLNLADGLDGFAGGVGILIVGGLLVLTPTPEQLTVGLPLLAATLGFLWVNAHPAGLFLGDAGAFGIGAVIAGMALVSGRALLLPILAGVLVLEAVSVMAQILLFRLTGKRLLKMAPFHHHFEAAAAPQDRKCLLPSFEWPETQVTARLLILQTLFVALALWVGRLA